MDVNDPILLRELRRDEGVRYTPYKDSVGILTVGVGHNLREKPLNFEYPLTDAQVSDILKEDLVDVIEGLDNSLPWWETLTQARQRVLVNMAFNLGIPRLLNFHDTLKYLQMAQYQKAADEMLDSKWAHQVGARAHRLAEMVKNG